MENADGEPPSTELVGAAAEERGLWLAALRAAVSTVRCSSRFVPAFVQDFESAGGYETVGFMVRRSSIDRLPAMLEQVSACPFVDFLANIWSRQVSGGEEALLC